MGKRLLILGAGGHGRVVQEVALSIRNQDGAEIYEKVDFLDDSAEGAVGKTSELENFKNDYDEVFCGIGNNEVRKNFLEKAANLGFQIPVLIHPTAYISPSAQIEEGTVIEPKVTVNANAVIHRGCIISVGAIVDHDVVVGECAHVNAGAVCKAGAVVKDLFKLEAGEVIMGYPQAAVRKK